MHGNNSRCHSLVYAVVSLTVVRMLPVAMALIGTRLSRATVVFMGWFGPRGLDSIVLGLVYLEHEAHLPGEPTIRLAVMATRAAERVRPRAQRYAGSRSLCPKDSDAGCLSA